MAAMSPRAMMKQWKGGRGQADDAAEFQQLLLKTLACDELLFTWEKRLLQSENPMQVTTFDYTHSSQPIMLQVQHMHISDTHVSLRTLIREWSQDWAGYPWLPDQALCLSSGLLHL